MDEAIDQVAESKECKSTGNIKQQSTSQSKSKKKQKSNTTDKKDKDSNKTTSSSENVKANPDVDNSTDYRERRSSVNKNEGDSNTEKDGGLKEADKDITINEQESGQDKQLNLTDTEAVRDNQEDKSVIITQPEAIGNNATNHDSQSQEPLGSINKSQEDDEDDEDGDPIPSGTGAVSRECSASELVGWSEILPQWHAKLTQRPRGLDPLVRKGIPEPLRGEVWQLLAGAEQCLDLMERYRIFLTKSAPTEQIILRDVHRTYPAHENFRSGASSSSSLIDSLFKVCKAYAVYDEEVGYCQGLSFLVAALLLHMPEEQAFCVFVRIMQHYGLRGLFRNNFDELYLKFYQLERLLEDHMPDLHQHFVNIGIEPFTYASQWFLTVFTAKFPLNAVFYIMDIFLLDGMNTIFQIALALLGSSKQELLALDFEGVLKYFRVQMPKRYRNQENVQQLILASSEISLKKLKKHAKNYEFVKQKEKLLENPLSRLQRENSKLTENNLRLEQENDDLARDLVASKIQLRAQLDALEDKMETLNRALTYSRQDCQTYLATISDIEDEKSRLEVEVCQLKEVCRRELSRAETELARDSSIISDYKGITSQLSKRLDKQVEIIEKFIISTCESLKDNKLCKDESCHKLFQLKGEELLDRLKNIDNNQLTSQQEGAGSEANLNESPKSLKPGDASSSSASPSRQQVSSRVEKVSAESQISNRHVGAYIKSKLIDSPSTSSETKIEQLTKHIDELEIELARTKLALVEAECKCQQLTHDLNVGVTVKTSGSSEATSGGLAGKLDLLRTAVSSSTKRSSPRSSTFAKINNLISEKILASGGIVGGSGGGGSGNTSGQSYYQVMASQASPNLMPPSPSSDRLMSTLAGSTTSRLSISSGGDDTIVSEMQQRNSGNSNNGSIKINDDADNHDDVKTPPRLPISAQNISGHNSGSKNSSSSNSTTTAISSDNKSSLLTTTIAPNISENQC